MGVTTTQLQAVSRFTYGSATHHVERATEDVELVRRGAGTDVFYRHVFTIDSYLEGSTLGNLKTQFDNAIANLAKANQDFALYRGATKVREILAADAYHGPVAKPSFTRAPDMATFQGFTVTVEALVPVSVSAGLIAHTYSERTTTDDDDVDTRIVRTGEVTTAEGTSAVGWIEANLPSKPAGYVRTVDINRQDAADTSATYTITDDESPYRNAVPGTVKTHTYTDTEITDNGDLIQSSRTGSVETIDPEDAGDWVEANLPALASGFRRRYQIAVDDTRRLGTYTVTDDLINVSGTLPPGIDEGVIDVRTSEDDQKRKVVVTSGRFVGSNAQTEVDNIRSGLANIIRAEVTVNTLGNGEIRFSFTQLLAVDDDDFLAWQETIEVRGGGRSREVRLIPDAAPFIFNGPQLPYTVSVFGRAEGLTQYVAPPGLISGLESAVEGEPEEVLARDNANRFITTWRQRYVVVADPGSVKPRSPVVSFIP